VITFSILCPRCGQEICNTGDDPDILQLKFTNHVAEHRRDDVNGGSSSRRGLGPPERGIHEQHVH